MERESDPGKWEAGCRQRGVRPAFDLPYSFKARFEDGQPDTNPEELIGAARRRAAIAELYTEDCELYVPPGKFVGREALDKR